MIQARLSRQLLALADRVCQGAGATIHTPSHRHRELFEHYRQYNRDHARLRAPGERAFTRPKERRILRKAPYSTNRIGHTGTTIHAIESAVAQDQERSASEH
ncbi:hypothetical protein SUDANB6_01806 [Streptomyces sp. enrichment culture]